MSIEPENRRQIDPPTTGELVFEAVLWGILIGFIAGIVVMDTKHRGHHDCRPAATATASTDWPFERVGRLLGLLSSSEAKPE